MTNGLDSTLVPPSKKTVNFLYNGLVVFYPESIFGSKEGKKRGIADSWGGYTRLDFAKFICNITGEEDTAIAAKKVLYWKKAIEGAAPLETTVPANLDEMVSQLDDNASGRKRLDLYGTRELAKRALLASQKAAEEPVSRVSPKTEADVSTAEVITKAAGPLSVFAGRILVLPFSAAVYLSGPTVHASKAEGEGPGVATARDMLRHGINSSSLLSLESAAQRAGITSNQLRKLVELIKIEEKAHPFASKWVTILYSSQRAQLTQAQIVSLLTPSPDRTMAVLPRKSLLGNLFGRVGQQVFGKVTSKILKTATKKVAKKVVTAAAAKGVATATGTAIGGPIGTLVGLVGSWFLTKVKDLSSKLLRALTGEGNKRLRWAAIGSTFFGGIFLMQSGYAVAGGLLTATGAAAGLGQAAMNLKGTATSGANFGQTVMFGLTSVALPAIGVPLVIALVSIPVLVAIILFIINSGAYVVPFQTGLAPGLIESPYIGIIKTANPAGPFENKDLPVTIEYTIAIRAKRGALTIKSFEETCTVIIDGPKPACSGALPEEIPDTISPTEPFSFTYSKTYNSPGFEDSLVLNTFTVTADAEGKENEQAAATASIKIGNPPDECPNGWPAFGALSQGAYSTSTHRNAEAIDITAAVGDEITARHSGTVRVFGNVGPYGKHVEVISICNGEEFFSRYAHLSVVSVKTGQSITLGQPVGLGGNTGNSTGPHLHYEFRDPSGPKRYPTNPPYMMTPFVPKDLPRGCVKACNTVIP